MPCRTIECEERRAKRNKGIAIAALAVAGILVFGVFILPPLSSWVQEGWKQTPGEPGQSVIFKGYANVLGAGTAGYGTMTFFNTTGGNLGSGAVSAGLQNPLRADQGTRAQGYSRSQDCPR